MKTKICVNDPPAGTGGMLIKTRTFLRVKQEFNKLFLLIRNKLMIGVEKLYKLFLLLTQKVVVGVVVKILIGLFWPT